MSMLHISMFQALSVWSELEQAYFGQHRYGGDTAEIYLYRLMEHSPLIGNGYTNSQTREVRRGASRQSANALCQLCRIFEAERHCTIEINDTRKLEEWASIANMEIEDRCRIRVIRKTVK